MKKFGILGLLTCCILAAGCGNQAKPVSQEEVIPQEVIEEETITNELGEDESYYSGNVTIAGIGPDESLEATAEEGTLVLLGYFEDHTDHLFVAEGLYNCDSENECIPGNTAFFDGIVEWVDGAAGNHYYNVTGIATLSYEGVSNNTNDTFECSDAEKEATACPMNLDPVCGSNNTTYDNSCLACASKEVDTYTQGDCPEEITGEVTE